MIHIAASCDANYAQHLGVMLCSLLENQEPRRPISFYILDGGILETDKTKLHELVSIYPNVDLNFFAVPKERLNGLRVDMHITAAAYYRLLLPELVSTTVNRLLYLDCDLIIIDNVAEIWDIDLTGYPLAAVSESRFNRYRELGMPPGSPYFNSGVLLLDLAAWRQDRIGEKVLEYVRTNPEVVLLWDQDAMNALLFHEWRQLHPRWNVQTAMFTLPYNAITGISLDLLSEALNNPAILHFTGTSKPWLYMDEHPKKAEYDLYLKKTPWRNNKPIDLNLANRMKKAIHYRALKTRMLSRIKQIFI